MATATKSGQSLSFTYGYDGLRTTKTVNGVVYTYYYSGGKLMRLTYAGNTLDFFYDQNGTPFMLLHNSNIYYYITNAQGDVIRLVDINGNTAASYRYDPYGKAISALGSHATINPLRYRGYVYDHETGLYYLQSRYYDPEIGRFINADAFAATGQGLIGNNMFAYCRNNPISRKDITGTWDLCVEDSEDDDNPLNDMGGASHGGGGGGGNSQGATGSSQGGNSDPTTFACFIAGTLVQGEQDSAPIESISVGDKVWAWDEETGSVSLKEIVETYVNETTELVHVFVNGEEIITTPAHPFYSPVKGWTAASHLRAGDILVTANGNLVVIEKIQHEFLETPIEVYNFQVADFHTYYVSLSGVLVHNKCNKSFDPNQQKVIELAKEYEKIGMTREEAETLVKWANEYGILNVHGPMIHGDRSGYWSHIEHINIINIHIRVF